MAREFQVERPSLDDFVAELTEAVYPVALRHAEDEAWLDLELNLWKALGKTVRKWGRHLAQIRNLPENESDDVHGLSKTLGDFDAGWPPATLSNVIGLGHARDARLSRFGE
jgi:hypothetical protein